MATAEWCSEKFSEVIYNFGYILFAGYHYKELRSLWEGAFALLANFYPITESEF